MITVIVHVDRMFRIMANPDMWLNLMFPHTAHCNPVMTYAHLVRCQVDNVNLIRPIIVSRKVLHESSNQFVMMGRLEDLCREVKGTTHSICVWGGLQAIECALTFADSVFMLQSPEVDDASLNRLKNFHLYNWFSDRLDDYNEHKVWHFVTRSNVRCRSAILH